MNPVIRSLVFLLFLSCKPALKVTINPAPQPVPNPNGTKLYRMLLFEQPGREIDIYEYHYDCFDRVTEIGRYQGDSLNGKLQMQFISGVNFFYHNDEQLPYKSTGLDYQDSTAENYYFYDSNGRVILDSVSINNTCKYYWQNDTVTCNKKKQ
jgi:hypothetical protein